DQFGPHANSMSSNVSKSSCGFMRSIRSIAVSTGSTGSAAGSSSSTPGARGAVGVQRPVGVFNAVGAAVHLKFPPVAFVERMQRQLHLTRSLLRQNDRLVEEDLFDVRRCTDGGQSHRGIRGAGNDDGAVDDVVGQP